ncbi:hypothetical protein MUN84_14425 [Hymenobacter sp. 5516J-16]|uniref:Lipoprotein n=1 Tax=Hymenobacter sublimis TaxID=2933777 RepID=A0ABY4JCK0_9BACT|nr:MULTISPECIES: hypothetical protein [Hymenobacter]UOQ75830.1 hypothetical protein MUN84_14425 [Hymenobacter sp. 5516J-16]UPL49511.1 hypothetical protein MWH26_01020 [Hymenobacter sublimis]
MFRFRTVAAVLPLAMALPACSLRMQPAEKPRPGIAVPPLPAPKPPRIYRLEHLDTLVQVPGRVLRIYPAARPVYERLPSPHWVLPQAASAAEEESFLDFAAEEKRRLLKAGPRVFRKGRALYLRPTASREVRLVNNPVEDERNVAYEYLATLPEIKQWLVSVHLYEGGYYMLIDQRTGHRTQLMAPPVIAPDGQHFVCGNSDVLARFEPSGLQLWSMNDGVPHLLWERQTEWGCTQPRWLDNKTILFEQDFFDKGDVDTRVVRLKVIP